MAINLYSNKQKWKIILMVFALCMVGAFLFVSNTIVSKVGDREKERARQWADAIIKKLELVQLTNRTFTQLRDKERKEMALWIDASKEVSQASPLDIDPRLDFPFKIIKDNKDIPVILLDDEKNVSGFINLDFDTSDIRITNPTANSRELNRIFEDSLVALSSIWEKSNPPFTVEVYEDLFMTYFYKDSKEIVQLEKERDSLINAFNKELINNEGLVPVLLIDAETKAVIGSNLEKEKLNPENLSKTLSALKFQNEPLVIDFQDGRKNILYFDDSPELKQLQYFPYIQFIIIGLFVFIGSNLEKEKLNPENLSKTLSALKFQNEPLVIDFQDGRKNILYFDDSPELKQLQYFPYIQFIIIGLFVFIGYLIFSTFRKAEQNQVWAGMAKETAHQLGTPLSSLMAWIQLLEAQEIDPMIPREMQKDVERLEKVTDRFSKIGSGAKLENTDLRITVKNVLDYLRLRIASKVSIEFIGLEEVNALHNPSLMEWVIENICKNAVDSMENVGSLIVTVHKSPEWAHIDIKDTGKGIPPNQLKTIFQPGFTTKKRGWGLGLSLVKRIVKEYHKGKVFVLESQEGVGTTFRISIPL